MEAIDEEGGKSAPFYILVVVKPVSSTTNMPQVNKNLGLSMFEGRLVIRVQILRSTATISIRYSLGY